MNLLVQSDRILDNFRILQKQAGRTPLLPLLEGQCLRLRGCGDGPAAGGRGRGGAGRVPA